ncbi:MAG TPA: TonB-dependent receptor, partial [Saprospiraceae bacterium]|nr:TonB-dependent receptor [Saprospiraceae bacterium]
GSEIMSSPSVPAVLGYRNSVLWDRPANVSDTINATTLAYNARQVDIDNFNSYTTELRLLHHYELLGNTATLAAGVQYMHNGLNRRQLGTGTTGSDYDLSVDANGFRRDLWLRSRNIAFFLENKFQLTRSLSLSPGFRYESGHSKLSGKTTYYDPQELLNTIAHKFPLLGINAEYQISKSQSLYAGWSQAYRPVILKDIIPANIYEQVNKNLKDAYGYNMEIGWRGNAAGFKWDLSGFALQYNNRLGTLAEYDAEIDTFVLYRTNIGDARTLGVEAFAEYGFDLTDNIRVNVFTSSSWFHSEYLGDSLRVNSRENRSIAGNRVESVPEWISRNGLNIRYKGLSLSALYSYTGETFADPFNTVPPSANAAVGLVPAYDLFDLNSSLRLSSNLMLRVNVNNVFNKQYFTKRPTFYPGPGIWPSDGRSFVATLTIRL